MSRDCDECGEPIPAARIKLLPGVRACAPCAEELERQARRPKVTAPQTGRAPAKLKPTTAEMRELERKRVRKFERDAKRGPVSPLEAARSKYLGGDGAVLAKAPRCRKRRRRARR
jgi:hypothetical protein